MRGRWLAAAVGVSVAGLVLTSGGVALAKPVAPGRSVTATLQNDTLCTLRLTGGTVAAGQLTQDVPLTIAPHASGTWKITGWNAFGDADADLAVVFAVTNCAQAGAQEGYAMQNTDAGGLWYTDNACAVSPAPGLRNTFTATPAYHATLTIDLTVTAGQQVAVHPDLGACGGLPLS